MLEDPSSDMPRFGSPELGSFSFGSPSASSGSASASGAPPLSFASPSQPKLNLSTPEPTPAQSTGFDTPNQAIVPSSRRSQASASSSLSLSCLSPNGRWVHSLAVSAQNDGTMAFFVESHSLPLAGSTEAELAASSSSSSGQGPKLVRTRLPAVVERALERYPALELLCVDTDAPPPPGSFIKLPLLCIYTKKDAFVVDIAYHPLRGASEIDGMIQSVSEPFERILLEGSTSLSIVRIRQGPQQWSGYPIMCPPECMALLTHDSSINEYSLHLYHGIQEIEVTTPVSYQMEQLEDASEAITDFCFCQSSSFSVLSSLCVAFLKGTGDVLIATPILFHGTVLPRASVRHVIELLHAHLDTSDVNTAQWRRMKSSIQYLMDAFPDDGGKSHYITARGRAASFEWPAQMQGPVLSPPETDDFETLAVAITPVYAVDMCGFSIGHVGDVVDFGVLAPSSLLPRFQLESPQDTTELDQTLTWGAIVQRVDLSQEPSYHQPNNPTVAIIHDPIMNSVVHFVSPSHIMSISSNSIKLCVNKIKEQTGEGSGNLGMFSPSQPESASPRTTVWSCLDISQIGQAGNVVSIVGATVSGDARFGHVLVARLSDGTVSELRVNIYYLSWYERTFADIQPCFPLLFTGSMIPVNLTETRHFHEMNVLAEKNETVDTSNKTTSASESLLRSVQETSPLSEMLAPKIEAVLKGLGSMGKIVGSATQPKDITPDMLAVAMNIKEQCDKEVLLPILEMKEEVENRKKELKAMYENQVSQLKALQDAVANMKETASSIKEQAETASENAKSLALRSSAVLESSTALIPTLTEAEYNYFNELKMLQEKTKRWEDEIQTVSVKATDLSNGIDSGRTAEHVNIEDEAAKNATLMLKACGKKIENYRGRLDKASDKISDLAAVARLDLDQEEPLLLTQ